MWIRCELYASKFTTIWNLLRFEKILLDRKNSICKALYKSDSSFLFCFLNWIFPFRMALHTPITFHVHLIGSSIFLWSTRKKKHLIMDFNIVKIYVFQILGKICLVAGGWILIFQTVERSTNYWLWRVISYLLIYLSNIQLFLIHLYSSEMWIKSELMILRKMKYYTKAPLIIVNIGLILYLEFDCHDKHNDVVN